MEEVSRMDVNSKTCGNKQTDTVIFLESANIL